MNKILEIPEGENIKYDKQAEKMQVYKQLCESLESRDKRSKKIITCEVIAAKINENTTQEYRVCAQCIYKNFFILVPMYLMGFILPEGRESITPKEKEAAFTSYIRAMKGATIDVIIEGINIEESIAIGNRKKAMEYKRELCYFRTGKSGMSMMERAFRDENFVQARVVTVKQKQVFVDLMGLTVEIYARDVVHVFTEDLHKVISVGDIVPVKIKRLAIDRENKLIDTYVSIKDATENRTVKNMKYYTTGSEYLGIVTNIRNGYYVQIGSGDLCVDVFCKNYNTPDGIAPRKGDKVSVVIAFKDLDNSRLFGHINEVVSHATYA